MSRRPRIATDDEPATVPAVVSPLAEDSAATWARWSEDRAERERAERIEVEAKGQTALDRAVYSREIAEAIADDAAKQIPDWRLLRPEVAAAFIRIVRQQPEYRQREIQQHDSVMRLIEDNLPAHIRPLVRDVHTITELITLAREAAAFLVGHATGRKAARLHTDDRGRVRTSTRPNRGPLRVGIVDGPSGPAPEPPRPAPLVSLPEGAISLKAIQKAAITAALEAEDWSQARAAERLQMEGGLLNQQMKRLRIDYPPEHAHKRRPRRTRAIASP